MKTLALIAPIFCATTSFAAISKNAATVRPPAARSVLLQATRDALSMPFANRLETLENQGPSGYRNLVAIMFDETAPMATRWRAVTAAGRIGGKESVPELERALNRPEWFMRNAGLVSLAKIDRRAAIKWARKLLSDRALVVRAAAVEMLADLHDTESTTLLWEKLYAKENYRNKQSLFIRRRIVEALSMLQPSGGEGKFVRVLGDSDENLHPLAILALEKLTKNPLGTSKDTVAFKRERWQKWWAEKAQAKL